MLTTSLLPSLSSPIFRLATQPVTRSTLAVCYGGDPYRIPKFAVEDYERKPANDEVSEAGIQIWSAYIGKLLYKLARPLYLLKEFEAKSSAPCLVMCRRPPHPFRLWL
jgi:hypothetical protein